MGEAISRWARLHGWLPTIVTLGTLLALVIGLVAAFFQQQSRIETLEALVENIDRSLLALHQQMIVQTGINNRQEGQWDVLEDRLRQIIAEARANAESRGNMQAIIQALQRDTDRHEAILQRLYVPPAATPQPLP